ncbi:hypothetical protein C6P97_21125 [Burkholderia multivorans]|uniref:Uncharacterized protein n=1 Tax=Burkholderia multivorans TaxID=87883 RepID=A0AB37AR17_9BURK|nr:hypothetical protein C6P97_21125 [Burkholderia multivorans]PRE46690.1 hypothetical protein C6P99_16980 [Burkholderia multivorans]
MALLEATFQVTLIRGLHVFSISWLSGAGRAIRDASRERRRRRASEVLRPRPHGSVLLLLFGRAGPRCPRCTARGRAQGFSSRLKYDT